MSLIRTPYEFNIMACLGKVPGLTTFQITGENAAVGAVAPEFISQSGLGAVLPYTNFPTAASTIQVLSSSAADAVGGGGATKIMIVGLDANWDVVTEELTLNGLAVVTGAVSFIRVNKAYITESEFYQRGNVGNITIRYSTGPTVVDIMLAQRGVTQSAIYSVPRDHTLLVFDAHVVIESTKVVDLLWRYVPDADDVATPFKPQLTAYEFPQVGTSIDFEFFHAPHKFLEKTDVWWTGQASAGTAQVSVEMDCHLYNNTIWNL